MTEAKPRVIKSRTIVALGGNALGNTDDEQRNKVADIAPVLVDMMEHGNEIILVHGNGPQVGIIQKAFTLAHGEQSDLPVMELYDACAMSQGYLGFYLQQGLANELERRGKDRKVATIVTEIEVDKDDPAFQNPVKPIGLFLTRHQVDEQKKTHPTWIFKEDSGRGYRRVVPSPTPKEIVELASIRHLLDDRYVVIACGGGGIPVVKDGDALRGISAILDKDLASSLLAQKIDAEKLVILTAVDYVCINFNTPQQKELKTLTVSEAQKYLAEGQFGAGSMEPKVRAAMQFVQSAPGRKAIIANLEKAAEALQGKTGTILINDEDA